MTTTALNLELLAGAMPAWNVPGMQVVAVQDGEVLHAGGLGVSSLDTQAPVTDRTLFDHGSCGKAYTALIGSLLHDEGVLDLDEPVRRHVPELSVPDEAITEQVTVRDLLSHRSGLSRHDLAWILNGTWDRPEVVDRLRHLPAAGPLRGQWLYSNFGYALAGHAMGRAAGTTWERLLAERVLEPLGMGVHDRASVAGDPERGDGHALADGTAVATPHRDLDGVAPAGFLVASAQDAARWLLLQAGEPLLSQHAVGRTREVQLAMDQALPFPELEIDGYGLGWAVGRFHGHEIAYHSGGIDGFLTQTLVLPERRTAVLVSANQHMSGLPLAGVLTLAEQLLGEPDGNWLTKLRPPAAEPIPPRRPADTAGLVGRWSDPGYGELVIRADGTARIGSADLAVVEGEGGPQLHYPPLDFVAELKRSGDALESPLDPGTPPVRFVQQS